MDTRLFLFVISSSPADINISSVFFLLLFYLFFIQVETKFFCVHSPRDTRGASLLGHPDYLIAYTQLRGVLKVVLHTRILRDSFPVAAYLLHHIHGGILPPSRRMRRLLPSRSGARYDTNGFVESLALRLCTPWLYKTYKKGGRDLGREVHLQAKADASSSLKKKKNPWDFQVRYRTCTCVRKVREMASDRRGKERAELEVEGGVVLNPAFQVS